MRLLGRGNLSIDIAVPTKFPPRSRRKALAVRNAKLPMLRCLAPWPLLVPAPSQNLPLLMTPVFFSICFEKRDCKKPSAPNAGEHVVNGG